jgi:outer membrane protein OmpA-like peptidoglycan-associated protein
LGFADHEADREPDATRVHAQRRDRIAEAAIRADGSRPGSLSAASVLSMSQAAGNRGTARLLRSKITKRPVGEPGEGILTGYEPREKDDSRTTPGRVEDTKDGTLLTNFAVNDNGIKPEHERALRKLFKDLRWDSKESLFPIKEIIGFTDAVHRKGGNEELREDRAITVQGFLQIIGTIPANQGVTSAAPSTRFVDTNATRPGRARNRSVVISTDAFLPPDPPPPKPKPKQEEHTKWFIGGMGSFAMPFKPGVAIDIELFRIREDGGNRFAVAFAGGGPGVTLDLGALLKDAVFASKVLAFVLKLIASGAVSLDVIEGSEKPFSTVAPANKRSFFGIGVINHTTLGDFGIEHIGLPPHTRPEDIELSGQQISLGLTEDLVEGLWIPI